MNCTGVGEATRPGEWTVHVHVRGRRGADGRWGVARGSGGGLYGVGEANTPGVNCTRHGETSRAFYLF